MSFNFIDYSSAPQLRADKAEGELARIKDELREFAEDNGFNPEMEPRDLLAKATGSFRLCAAISDARYDEVQRLKAEMEAMRLRLMPEGMAWPRYDSGELVQIGDYVQTQYGPDKLRQVRMCRVGFYLSTDGCDEWHRFGERVKRPVLAADGEPLEAGQTVWHVATGSEYTVVGLPKSGEYQAVKLRLDDGAFTGLDPDQLTHQRPVLDADGVLEPPDSIERIADEIDRLREEVALHLGDYLYDEDGNDSIQFSMELVAKRCRALAERERVE